MGILSKILGGAALAIITISPVAYALSGITLGTCKVLLLAATGAWFVAATMSWSVRSSTQANGNQQTA